MIKLCSNFDQDHQDGIRCDTSMGQLGEGYPVYMTSSLKNVQKVSK